MLKKFNFLYWVMLEEKYDSCCFCSKADACRFTQCSICSKGTLEKIYYEIIYVGLPNFCLSNNIIMCKGKKWLCWSFRI